MNHQSTSVAHLARRITRWSGNLLATAVIVILGLTFGRQIVTWWRGDEPPAAMVDPAASPHLDQLTDPQTPLLLTFGDMPYTFDRRVVSGDQSMALAELRRQCREAAESYDPRRNAPLAVSPEVLHRLSQQPAVEQGVGCARRAERRSGYNGCGPAHRGLRRHSSRRSCKAKSRVCGIMGNRVTCNVRGPKQLVNHPVDTVCVYRPRSPAQHRSVDELPASSGCSSFLHGTSAKWRRSGWVSRQCRGPDHAALL